MEKIGVLMNLTESDNTEQITFDFNEIAIKKVERMNSRVGSLDSYDGIDCKLCKNKGVIYYLEEFYDEALKECECLTQRKIHRELKNSGLEYEFKTKTFDAFKTKNLYQKIMKEKALHFIDSENPYWFTILGQSGSGKTHLCTAISNTLINQGKTFKYFPFARDIIRIANGLKSFNPVIKKEAEELIEEYKKVDVLYIDDFLKIKTYDVVFELIDYRYSANLKTIISSELSIQELLDYDVAIAGRIREKSGEFVVSIKNDPERNMRMKGVEI